MSKLIGKLNGEYFFRDYKDCLHIPEKMMQELKDKMSYEESIMCFMDALLDLEDKERRIDKAIEYIENECLDENKLYCHDLIGNDIYEVLDILKGSDNNE